METSKQGSQILKHLPVALAIADLAPLVQGQGLPAFTWLNDRALLLFGRTELPITGQGLGEVLGEPGLEALRSLVAGLEKGGASAEAQLDVPRGSPGLARLRIRAAWPEGRVGAWDQVLIFFEPEARTISQPEAPAERENLFRAILETAAEGYFLSDARGHFLDVNTAYCELMGYSREELLSMSIVDQAADSNADRLAARLARIRGLGRETFETRHRRRDGRILDVEVSSSYLAGGQGRFVSFCRDISPRKQAERLYREQEERLSLALSCTGAGLWDWDVVGGSLLVDVNWGAILGIGPSELRTFHKQDWDSLCHPEDLRASERALLDHFLGQTPRYVCEMRTRHKGGAWVWTRTQGEVVERDDQGRPTRVIGLMFDIDSQKEGEGRLRTTIAEKESLLSELYHRTKNSMQLINAMLELKKHEVGNPLVSSAFEDIENKILAMALVQEKLYQADTISSIDLGAYVEDLMELFHAEMAPAGKRIEFRASQSEMETVEVTADVAIPCGLILSELVGNSVAHGFHSRDSGSISVSVYKDRLGEIHIEEWDDGVGLPEGYDPRTAGRVGLRTVIGIGEEQLHGMFSFGTRSTGFSCALRFKDIYYPRRV